MSLYYGYDKQTSSGGSASFHGNSNLDLKGHKITNLGQPVQQDDAVNLKFVNKELGATKCGLKGDTGTTGNMGPAGRQGVKGDQGGQGPRGPRGPKGDDASLSKVQGDIGMNRFRIVGLADPINAQNAVTKSYMELHTISQTDADKRYERKGAGGGVKGDKGDPGP